jgi:alkylation response protein AidB-like acyl-CoA dehydrogenase
VPLPPIAHIPSEWDQVLGIIETQAAQSDRDGVPRSHFDSLASVGAHGEVSDPSMWRELTERIAGADASTWFCWAQHQTPLRTLAAGGNQPSAVALQARWLPGMKNGSTLAAVAFAHIRRPGPANPVARKLNGSWQLTGTLDWVTSWDIADVVMLMALNEDKSEIVTFFIPIVNFEEVISMSEVGEKLQLLSMSGTHTRPIRFAGSVIPNEFLFSVTSYLEWQQGDQRKTIAPNLAALGIARSAIDELAEIGASRKSVSATELAESLSRRYLHLRAQAMDLIDQAGLAADSDLLETRVEILELARECATAVVIARAGASMQVGSRAERRIRDSMFLQVQAQTEITRNAALDHMNSAVNSSALD